MDQNQKEKKTEIIMESMYDYLDSMSENFSKNLKEILESNSSQYINLNKLVQSYTTRIEKDLKNVYSSNFYIN